MVEFDLSKITGREPPTDDGLPCACEWNAAGEPVGLCAAHQSKLDDELAALRAENATLIKALAHERVRNGELRAEVLDVRESLSAAESREVCTVAHDGDVATCGYCQRDALRARVAELEAAGRAVIGCNDQVCAFAPNRCEAQCRADEMLHAALRASASAGAANTEVSK